MKYPVDPILLIDDEKEFLFSAALVLKSEGINHIVKCSDSRKVYDLVKSNTFSVIVCDMSMPNIGGFEILSWLAEYYPEIPVIIITALQDIQLAIDSLKLGAVEYLLKPIEDEHLVSSIKRSIHQNDLLHENIKLKEMLFQGKLKHPEHFDHIATKSERMYTIFKYIEAISVTHLPVLIQGETGVGKELIANAIHKSSGRSGDLIAVNVAGLDDNLFSDTLFGHEKGAFTGAEKYRAGLIEKAQDGTLFLDEIGDLSVESQVKLLRLIQENKYYPLGSDMPKSTNARIIVATHKDLNVKQKEKSFRSDLYYRLQSHKIQIPSLRERKEDIPIILDFLLKKAAKSLNMKMPNYPKSLITIFKNYSFPGNVREMEGMILDALSRHESGILSLDSFKEKITFSIEEEIEVHHTNDNIKFGDDLPTLKEAESALIQEALNRSDQNQTIAAELLGISRRALNNRLNR